MTLQECYVKIGGDYNDILHRFMNENMVRKFVLKFPQDNNMALFEESWAKKDYETAFRAMHTLKGVSVNLGFTALYNVSSALTEKLRSQEYDNLDVCEVLKISLFSVIFVSLLSCVIGFLRYISVLFIF